MLVEGTYRFAAPVERVFRILLDPEVVAKTMPGARELKRVLDGRYEGVVRVGLGPLAADFDLVVQLADVREPNHYRLDIDSTGRVGWTRGQAVVDLEAREHGTEMRYRADLAVGGTMTRIGHGLLDSVSRMMTQQGLESLRLEVERRIREPEPPPPPGAPQHEGG